MVSKSIERCMLISCLIGVLLINCCHSSTFLTPPIVHPGFPGRCFEPTRFLAVEPGQTIDIPRVCVKLTCLKDLRFSGVGCISEESVDPNCHEIPGDFTKSYPDCCPKYECNYSESDNISNQIDDDRK